MPHLDYAALRAQISIRSVLQQCNYVPLLIRGDQWRGPCPLHGPEQHRDRCFSVNIRKNVFRCFRGQASGNQLDLWISLTNLSPYEAALDLCQRLHIEPPPMPSICNSGSRNS
jgi:DNA primase